MRICIHTVRRWAHQTGRKQVCGRCEGVVPSRVLSRLRCLPRLAPGLLPQMVLRQILVLPDTNWQPAVTSPRLASPRHGRRAALLVTRSLHGALRIDAPWHEASTWAPRQARNSLQQWTHVHGGTTTPPGPVATPTSGTGRTHMAWNGTGSLEATRPGRRHLFGVPSTTYPLQAALCCC